MKTKQYVLLIVALMLSTFLIGCGGYVTHDTQENTTITEGLITLEGNRQERESNKPIALVLASDSDCQLNDSTFVADVTIPDNTVMAAGQTFVKTWRLKNSGACPWTTNYEFVSIDNDSKGRFTVPVEQEVAPGGFVDLSINFTAPTQPGTHRSTWQLRTPDGTLFGDIAYVQIVVTEQAAGESEEQCNHKSAFLSDVTIPDDTVVAPGQSLRKTWRLKNSGSCPWSTNYEFVFIEGEQMGAPSTVPVPQDVAPGESLKLSVDFTAPTEPGTYRSTWQLRTPDGTLFGAKVYVQIVVEDPIQAAGIAGLKKEVFFSGRGGGSGQGETETCFTRRKASSKTNSWLIRYRSVICLWDHPLDEKITVDISAPTGKSYSVLFEIEGEGEDAIIMMTNPLTDEQEEAGKIYDDEYGVTALELHLGLSFDLPGEWNVAISGTAVPAANSFKFNDNCLVPPGTNAPTIRADDTSNTWGQICLWNFPLDEPLILDFESPEGKIYKTKIKLEWERGLVSFARLVRISPPTANDGSLRGIAWRNEDGTTAIHISTRYPAVSPVGQWNVYAKSANTEASSSFVLKDSRPGPETTILRHDFTPLALKVYNGYLIGETMHVFGTDYPPNSEFPVGIYKIVGEKNVLLTGKLITTDDQGNFRTSFVIDESYSPGKYIAYTVTDFNISYMTPYSFEFFTIE